MSKFGQGKQQMGKGGGQSLAFTEFSKRYGKYLGEVEVLMGQVVEQSWAIQLGTTFDEIKAVMGTKFATAVGEMRERLHGHKGEDGQWVPGELLKEHMGGFDGYMKKELADLFGPKSDLVQEIVEAVAAERGIDVSDESAMAALADECDQYDNALAAIMPGQARRKEMVEKCWAAFLKYAPEELKQKHPEMPTKSVDIQAFRAILAPIVDAEIERLKAARKSAPQGEEPKRSDFEPTGKRTPEGLEAFMNAKAAFASRGRGKSPEEEALGEVKGALSFLATREEKEAKQKARDQQHGSQDGGNAGPEPKKPAAPTLIEQADIDVRAVFETATMKMEEMLMKVGTAEVAEAYIKATSDWIAHLKGEELNFAQASSYTNAGTKQKEWGRIERMELPKLQKKLNDLQAAEANLARLKGAVAIVAQMPDARGITTVPIGDRVVIKVTKDKVEDGSELPDSIEKLNELLAAAEEERNRQQEALTRKEAEIANLRAEADAIRLSDRRGATRKDNEAIDQENTLDATRVAIENADRAIGRIGAKLEALEQPAAVETESTVTAPEVAAGGTTTTVGSGTEPQDEVPGLDEAMAACTALTAGKGLKRLYQRWDRGEINDVQFVADVEAMAELK